MSVASVQLIKDFNLKGVSAPEFFRSAEDIEKYAGRHPYSHLMRRAWEAMHLNGILCVDDIPTVYFKEVKRIDSLRQRERYQKFWNQGLATLLVISSPDEVQVFSSLAEPVKEDSVIEDEHRLVEILDSTAKVLFVRRVQTGQIYRDNPDSFQPDKAVDRFLLRNLKKARDQLHEHSELNYEIVHALLGRIIFTCYLVERDIIDEEQFDKAGAKGIKNLRELFTKYKGDKAKNILYDLFALLQKHFNGSMFDDTLEDERPLVDKGHIEILRRFLNGEELDENQLTFDFWAYDFRVIPVETISSIYEEFLAAEDEKEQRKSGAYYTPKYLAEMVVNVAVDGWNTLLGKKFLDPACGSGIFLVILFNRIAEQWRRKNPGVYNITRTEALLEIISEKLCGVDVNETACRIACFSLYLAFLDQLRRRDIHELEQKRGKVLDNFLALKENNYANTKTPVIFEGNFFDNGVPIEKSFDLVIGNPPWVSRGKASDTKAFEWCLSENNPYLKDAPRSKADRKQHFLPAKQIAHAFMWKSPVHLKANGKSCLVLPTKVLFNNKTDKFQAGWFSNVTVDKVIQLSDWRHILFENADCPAVIIKFTPQKPEEDYSIKYEVPKVSSYDPRRGVIDIVPEDRKNIRLSEIQESSHKKQISVVWKKKFWGTNRDVHLVDRLLEMPRLGDIVGKPEKPKQFISGQGFQPYLPEYYETIDGKLQPVLKENGKEKHGKPKPIWWPKKHLYINTRNKGINLILTRWNCCEFGRYEFEKTFTELRRSPDKSIFKPPMVLVNQGFSRKAFCDFPVLFRATLQSITSSKENASEEDRKLLMFLSAVLNTTLADYYSFHISANLGIERDLVRLEEIEFLPFPLPGDTYDPPRSRRIIDQIAKQMSCLKASIEKEDMGWEEKVKAAMQDIERLVYEYYGISEREQMLIEDTVKIFKRSMMPTSASKEVRTIRKPTPDERKDYVELLCGILNSWAKRSKFRVNGKVEVSNILGTSVVTLCKSEKSKPFQQSQTSDELQAALKSIQEALPERKGRFTYHRGLKVFDRDNLYIVKPLALRHWTKTAAINDADEIAAAILSSGRDS
ncbi:MAG TPA: N-6 DNA methylase [Planctomycetes bacterium]|nr:N-6 DNA methylase [Planctomycetota bacterium]